jgi:hypothetical protein
MISYQFIPSATQKFQFSPSLDGVTYTAVCPWNNFAQRYYISIYDSYGNLKCNVPVVESPDDYDINLIFGYFDTKMVYRASTSSFEVY